MVLSQNELWLNRAIGFAARARQEMWGKHNAEIMAFLFEYGFSNKTIEKHFLGWNRRGKLRSAESWGIDPEIVLPDKDKLFFPEGIVVPYIVEKKLEKLTIVVPKKKSTETINHVIAGSQPVSMILGDGPEAVGRSCVVENILDGLYFLQEWRLNHENEKISLIIPHDLETSIDNAAAEQLAKGETIIFLTTKNKESCENWAGEFDNSDICIYRNPEDMIKLIK